jgi:DNA invertase Pin-like site-specific DNA recombinase
VRIFLVDILTFDGFFDAKFDILKPRWLPTLGSFAEFEREMIRERTRAGLHEARAQGRVPGRKPKITSEQKKEIVEAVSSGRKTPAEIARLPKIHRATVSRIVSQAGV